MSGADIAWIIIAGFFGLGMVVLSIVLLNVFRLISQVGELVEGVTKETVPLIGSVNETVSGINVELARVDAIMAGVQHMTTTADSLVSVLHATVANPLVKAAGYLAGATAAMKAAKAAKEA